MRISYLESRHDSSSLHHQLSLNLVHSVSTFLQLLQQVVRFRLLVSINILQLIVSVDITLNLVKTSCHCRIRVSGQVAVVISSQVLVNRQQWTGVDVVVSFVILGSIKSNF